MNLGTTSLLVIAWPFVSLNLLAEDETASKGGEPSEADCLAAATEYAAWMKSRKKATK